jgi:hypothetical protein
MKRIFLLLLVLVYCFPTSAQKGKKNPAKPSKADCSGAHAELAVDTKLIARIGREPLMDLVPGQLSGIEMELRKRLREARKVENSPALRTETENLVYGRALRDAGIEGEGVDAYKKLPPAQQEKVARAFLARVGSPTGIEASASQAWFERKSTFKKGEYDAFFEVKQDWIDPERLKAYIDALVPKSSQ